MEFPTFKKAGRGLQRAVVGLTGRKARKRWLWGAAVVVTSVILFYAIENWRGARAWSEEVANWKALGGMPTVADFRPEPVADEDNFGAIPAMQRIFLPEDEKGIANLRRLETLSLQDHGPAPSRTTTGEAGSFRPWATALELVVPSEADELEVTRLVFEELERSRGALIEELAKGIECEHSAPPGEFYDGLENGGLLITVYGGHLFVHRAVGEMLELRGVAAARLGHRDTARECVGIGLQMARYCNRDWLVGALLGAAIQDQALSIVFEGLAERLWTEEDLVWLDRKLGQLEWGRVFRAVLRSELVTTLQAMDAMKRNPTLYRLTKPQIVGARLLPSGWVDRNKARLARLQREQCEMPTGPRYLWQLWTLARKQERIIEANAPAATWRLMSLAIPIWSNAVDRFIAAEAQRRQARIALALRRLELRNGELPEDLESLRPSFLAELPSDPVDGRPMRYRRVSAHEMALWSIGVDEADDSGTPPRSVLQKNGKRGDLVWGCRWNRWYPES